MTKEAMIRSLARRQCLMKAAAAVAWSVPGEPLQPAKHNLEVDQIAPRTMWGLAHPFRGLAWYGRTVTDWHSRRGESPPWLEYYYKSVPTRPLATPPPKPLPPSRSWGRPPMPQQPISNLR